MTEENRLSLAEFVPARAELLKMAEEAKTVDIKDAVMVHEVRFALRDARVGITKRGKELRDGALRFQKEVIAREKELVGIVQPEEERLQKIDEENKLRGEMEARRGELQSRVDALVSVGDELPVDEGEVLAMDDNEFNAYRLRRIEAKLVKDKEENEASVQKLADDLRAKQVEDDRARREELAKEEKARREKLAEDERISAERRMDEEMRLFEERKKVAVDRARVEEAQLAMERLEAGRKAEADLRAQELANQAAEAAMAASAKARREEDMKKEAAYQEWLKSIGFDEERGDIVREDDGIVTAYREMGKYKYEK